MSWTCWGHVICPIHHRSSNTLFDLPPTLPLSSAHRGSIRCLSKINRWHTDRKHAPAVLCTAIPPRTEPSAVWCDVQVIRSGVNTEKWKGGEEQLRHQTIAPLGVRANCELRIANCERRMLRQRDSEENEVMRRRSGKGRRPGWVEGGLRDIQLE